MIIIFGVRFLGTPPYPPCVVGPDWNFFEHFQAVFICSIDHYDSLLDLFVTKVGTIKFRSLFVRWSDEFAQVIFVVRQAHFWLKTTN